jgi:hypothetical protein
MFGHSRAGLGTTDASNQQVKKFMLRISWNMMNCLTVKKNISANDVDVVFHFYFFEI